VTRPTIAAVLAKEISPRGLNCSLQIEADIISFRFSTRSPRQTAQPCHIDRERNGFFSAYPSTSTILEISCQHVLAEKWKHFGDGIIWNAGHRPGSKAARKKVARRKDAGATKSLLKIVRLHRHQSLQFRAQAGPGLGCRVRADPRRFPARGKAVRKDG
jgi:hypothetical protein